MVKVFLFESAADGLTYLQRCCEHSSKTLCVWASEGIERFMQNNYPALAKNAYLFTDFWNLCLRQYGLKPLPNLFCYFMNLYKAPSPWAFESALKLSPDNDLLRAWLQAQQFGTIENFAQKKLEPIYDQIIIYGNLPHVEMQQAISVLDRLAKS